MRRYIQLPNQSDLVPGLELLVFRSGSDQKIPIQMMIDTGAARTSLPIELLEEDLDLFPFEQRTFRDFANNRIEAVLIFAVNFVIENNMIPSIAVLGANNPHYGLLDRDVLSRYSLRCDGPRQRFELEYQP